MALIIGPIVIVLFIALVLLSGPIMRAFMGRDTSLRTRAVDKALTDFERASAKEDRSDWVVAEAAVVSAVEQARKPQSAPPRDGRMPKSGQFAARERNAVRMRTGFGQR